MIWRKITTNQRQQLMQIYLHMGRDEARIMCALYGVHPEYAINQCRALSLVPKKKFSGGGDIALGVDHDDPRWLWAVQRGPVLA